MVAVPATDSPMERERYRVDPDLQWRSLTDLSRLLARRAVSSHEIVATYLDRIAALDTGLHAFVDVYRDGALAAADGADRERRLGATRGPLHGLPIAIKDLLHIRGRVTGA